MKILSRSAVVPPCVVFMLMVFMLVLVRQGHALVVPKHTVSSQQPNEHGSTRRKILAQTAATVSLIAVPLVMHPPLALARDEAPISTLSLNQGERAGLELYDTFSPDFSRQVVAIKSVSAEAIERKIAAPGMIITNFPNSKSVVDRLRNGPYPVDLHMILPPTKLGSPDESFVVRTVRDGSGEPSRRGDLLEFVYEARIGGPNGPVYDSSAQRGTGQPYQYVLGSGDLIPGVDAGLLKMKPGEVRQLTLPPPLAYGARGSRLYEIPPNTNLYWTVQMVRVNSRSEGEVPVTDYNF